jgi:hypothetical protein
VPKCSANPTRLRSPRRLATSRLSASSHRDPLRRDRRAGARPQRAHRLVLNERIVSSSKKAGTATLDTYERTLLSVAEVTETVGAASQVEWISTVAQAQADFTRDLTEAYTSSTRALLK